MVVHPQFRRAWSDFGPPCEDSELLTALLAQFTLILRSTVWGILVFCGLPLLSTHGLHAQVKTLDVNFKADGTTHTSIGEVIVEYPDGSLLFLTPDGRLWALHNEDIQSRAVSDQPMTAMTSEEIYQQFQEQLPPGFKIHKTKHYVLVHNTSAAYANWVAQLFERLYRGFYNYWKSQRVRLSEPRFPLVAVVFNDKNSYLSYAEREVGESAKAMIGYYNLNTNRMITYDLTGINGLVPPGMQIPSSRVVNQLLSQPQAERNVATIVHEAVHQISYNSGLQVRLADNPRWLSEGMAMYFESPDLSNSAGWSMGKVNYHNLRGFAQYLPNRPADSLTTLITEDQRLLDAKSARTAYPESWALTYFLMKTKRKNYAAYLQELAKLPPLGEKQSPRKRLDLFKKHFGSDLEQLDQQFIRYMRSVR